MSRSRRKTPIFGYTSAKSDAEWKAQSARALRRTVRQVLKATLDLSDFPGKRWDLVNPWSAPKDGKHWWRSAKAPDMRK
jgi:hypothetical protein